jgi:hypothetical protein
MGRRKCVRGRAAGVTGGGSPSRREIAKGAGRNVVTGAGVSGAVQDTKAAGGAAGGGLRRAGGGVRSYAGPKARIAGSKAKKIAGRNAKKGRETIRETRGGANAFDWERESRDPLGNAEESLEEGELKDREYDSFEDFRETPDHIMETKRAAEQEQHNFLDEYDFDNEYDPDAEYVPDTDETPRENN